MRATELWLDTWNLTGRDLVVKFEATDGHKIRSDNRRLASKVIQVAARP
jgi:hypothetical protein